MKARCIVARGYPLTRNGPFGGGYCRLEEPRFN